MDLHSSTWRQLGLSVGIGYILLGTFAITNPSSAAELFNLHPKCADDSTRETKNEVSNPVTSAQIAHADSIATSMVLLGARDLSIGVALSTFHYKKDSEAMGTLILSGMILCATDVIWIWKLRGWEWGLAFAAGATSWAVIGLGMLEYL